MGDAGYILFGPIGREILSWGTVIFAICGTGRYVELIRFFLNSTGIGLSKES